MTWRVCHAQNSRRIRGNRGLSLRRNGARPRRPFLPAAAGRLREIGAKVFHNVEEIEPQFEAGEFVAVQGKGNSYNQRLVLILDKIRRVT
jgi:hypothetical protein